MSSIAKLWFDFSATINEHVPPYASFLLTNTYFKKKNLEE